MCAPAAFAVAMAVGQGVMQYQSEKEQGKADLAMAKYNARVQENAAVKTRNKGIEDENAKRLETSQLASRQKAQLAASGLDVGYGTSLAIEEDTFLRGNLDAMRIRENAQDQAQAQEDQSRLTLIQGRNARRLARIRGIYGGVSSGAQTGASSYGAASSSGWFGSGSTGGAS